MIGELDDIKICGMASAVPTYEDDNSKNDSIDDRQELPVFLREEFPADIREVRIYVSERQNHFWKD